MTKFYDLSMTNFIFLFVINQAILQLQSLALFYRPKQSLYQPFCIVTTICRGVCGRFSGRYYEPVRKSLSKIKKRRLFGVIVLQDMGYFSSFLTDIMQIILNGLLFLLQFRVFVNLFPDEHQREAYKKQKTG